MRSGYPLALVLSLALWALAALVLPPLVRWALEHPLYALTIAACGVALAKYWLIFRHDIGEE